MFSDTDPRQSPVLEDEHGRGIESVDDEAQEDNENRPGDERWLRLARESFTDSETWFDSSLRSDFEDAMRLFNSEHPTGSKYLSESYKKKAKHFRPKTRSAIRRAEAATAMAFFSTQDAVHCSAVDEDEPDQRLAADIHNALLNYRLEERKQHWFVKCMGASQQAYTIGCVISRQDWLFKERTLHYDIIDTTTDQVVTSTTEQEILEDRPNITLIPPENLRLSPACDWTDPINTSPYLIELIPMFAKDILQGMTEINPATGEPYFRTLDMATLRAAEKQDWDSIRKAREGNGPDRYESTNAIPEYNVIWVHRNIVNDDDQDWVYETLGGEIMLSDPVPLETRYLHGIRPYAMGYAMLEAHKVYPSGIPKLVRGQQVEINDLANLRHENIRLALKKRYKIRRGAGVDIRALMKNVSGGGILMSDPERDVKEMITSDVTSSSYQEQDRLNLDFDDLAGVFSGSSVGSNRKLGETVGGMGMLKGDANQLTEYMVRTFSETWVEEVMRQMVALEAAYESDGAVLNLVGRKANASIEQILQVISSPINVRVNVGFNATDPTSRVNKLSVGLQTAAAFLPNAMQQLDGPEVIKEIFGALGWRDGARFFPNMFNAKEDPKIAELTQQVQQLTQIIESKQAEKQAEMQGKMQIEDMRGQAAMAREQVKQETTLLLAQAKGNLEQYMLSLKDKLSQLDAAIKAEEVDRKRQELYLQREALSASIQQADREFMLKVREMDKAEATEDPGPGATNLPGNDAAGVISRQDYGMIPGNGM